MAGMPLSDLRVNGKRVADHFKEGLEDIGRESEDWTIVDNGDGVTVKLVAANDGEVLFFGSDEFRVSGLSDEVIVARCREYQDSVLDRQD